MISLLLIPCTCCVCIRRYRTAARRWRFSQDLQKKEKRHNFDPENPPHDPENVGPSGILEEERQLPDSTGIAEGESQKLINKLKQFINIKNFNYDYKKGYYLLK